MKSAKTINKEELNCLKHLPDEFIDIADISSQSEFAKPMQIFKTLKEQVIVCLDKDVLLCLKKTVRAIKL